MTAAHRPLHDVLRADRVRAARALPDDLDPLPGLPQEDRPRHGLLAPDDVQPQTFIAAWNEGNFAQGMWGSFLVADDRDRRLRGALAVHRIRLRDDALPRLDAALQPDRGRADLPLRGDGHPALLRLPQLPPGRHQSRGVVLGADPAADRPVGHARDLLDARVLPEHAAGARRGRAHRRRRARSASCAACCCRRRGRRCSRSACSSSSTPGTSSCSRSCCSQDRTTRRRRSASRFFAGAVARRDPTKVAAASVLVAAPIVIVYLVLQRHFIRGVLAGAIKE